MQNNMNFGRSTVFLFTAFALFLQGPFCDAKLTLSAYYGDHMVLQRGPKRASIWGYAETQDIGANVVTTLYGAGITKSYTTHVRAGPDPCQATWSVMFDPVYIKSPFLIRINMNSEKLEIKDVLFGDVWVCSGQSNMCFTVSQIYNSSMELENAAKYTNIRVFSATKIQSKTTY